MPTFEFDTPDGRFEVQAPDQQTAIAAFQNHGKASGVGRNITAGLNEGIYGTLGAPVDLMRGALNLGIRGINDLTGAHLPQVPQDAVGGSQWIGEQLGRINPGLDPANTAANTMGEKLARGAGAGASMMLAPEAALGVAEKAGAVAPQLTARAAKLFGRSASVPQAAANAAVGAASGAGAAYGQQMAPESAKPLAATIGGLAGGGIGMAGAALPAIGREGVNLGRELVAPFTDKGTQDLAARALREAATHPGEVIGKIDTTPGQLIPGSQPTTFQQTGDMGIGALERASATKFPDQFMQRRADQNAARLGAMHGLQPHGAPEQVANAVRQHIEAIDRQTQQAVDNATQAARGRATALGPGIAPENAGDTLRASLEAARANAKARERELWTAVDPNGTLALPATATREQARHILSDMPASAKPPQGEEASIFQALGQYGHVVPFKELTALQSRLKDAMRQERLANGETASYRRMSQLNSAIQNDLENAVANKVALEQKAVNAGQMNPEDTLYARYLQKRDEWVANRDQAAATGYGGGSGVANAAGSRAAAFPGETGAGRQTGGGSGIAPGNPGLPGNAANFDQAALDRLTTARNATKERVNTFDNRQLAPLRARPSTVSNYNMQSSSVPASIFQFGPKGYESVQTYRNAVGDPEAMRVLEGYAVDRLRNTAMRPDGTLDPAKVQSWRRNHADALRAFPALDRRLSDAASASDTMARVAESRKQALSAAQKGTLGRIMGLEHPEDVTRAVGSLFGRQDSLKQITGLKKAIGSNAAAQTDLRKAIADYISNRFVGNTEAGTSGLGTIKSDQMQSFVKNNRSALIAAGFTKEEVDLMERLAQDLQRSNRSTASVKLPGGSNTAQDVTAVKKGDKPATMLTKILSNIGLAGGGVSGGFTGAAVGHAIGNALGSIRQSGLETVDQIIADALLNPGKAKMLLMRPVPSNENGAWKMLGALYRRTVAANPGTALAATHGNGRH